MTNTDTAAADGLRQGMTAKDYVRIARSYWKGITAFFLVTVLIAFAWASVQPRVYATESRGIFVAGGGDNLGMSLAGDNLAKSKAKNYESVAGSTLIADRVGKALESDVPPAALLSSVTISAPAETAEIRVTASANSPLGAQQLANAWIEALAAQVAELETAGNSAEVAASGQAAVRLIALGTASMPGEPVSPNTKLLLAIGGVLGLLLGAVYALLRTHFDRRLRTVEDVEQLVNVPVLGTIPVDHRLDEGSSIVEIDGQTVSTGRPHAISEALRELRTNLQFMDVDNPPRIIVVTSSVPSEGKSTVTANLAVTMAASGENVVVIDGDLRRPTVADLFQLVPGVGVTDVLSGRAEISDVLQVWGAIPNLHIMGSGQVPPNPSELLGSKSMKRLVDTLAKDAIVLIDAPPLLPVTDAAVLSRIADGALVVVRAGKTTQDELTRSTGNLAKAHGQIFGVILNCVPTSGAGSYSYYGSYASKPTAPETPLTTAAPLTSTQEMTDFDRIIASTTEEPAEPRYYNATHSRRSRS